MGWVRQAARLSGLARWVAVALWFVGIRSRDKSATVSLTLKTMRRFHLSRCAVYRGLAALEGARLVRVHRRVGRRLLVTILPAPQQGAF
jgi:hypothetical protein